MSRRIWRLGIWLMLFVLVGTLAAWSLPMRILLAHVSRGGALGLVLVGGVGLSLLVAALNERLSHQHTSHRRRHASDVYLLTGLGFFFAWPLGAEISDYLRQHFSTSHPPADRLSAVIIYVTCCSLFLLQGVLRWLAQHRSQVRRSRSR